jgi:hypothetical protein
MEMNINNTFQTELTKEKKKKNGVKKPKQNGESGEPKPQENEVLKILTLN